MSEDAASSSRFPALLEFCVEARERFREIFHRFHGSFHGRCASCGGFKLL